TSTEQLLLAALDRIARLEHEVSALRASTAASARLAAQSSASHVSSLENLESVQMRQLSSIHSLSDKLSQLETTNARLEKAVDHGLGRVVRGLEGRVVALEGGCERRLGAIERCLAGVCVRVDVLGGEVRMVGLGAANGIRRGADCRMEVLGNDKF
ncbi:hypothetical protein HK101_001471, partial [Irineochytrium annulatum]